MNPSIGRCLTACLKVQFKGSTQPFSVLSRKLRAIADGGLCSPTGLRAQPQSARRVRCPACMNVESLRCTVLRRRLSRSELILSSSCLCTCRASNTPEPSKCHVNFELDSSKLVGKRCYQLNQIAGSSAALPCMMGAGGCMTRAAPPVPTPWCCSA